MTPLERRACWRRGGGAAGAGVQQGDLGADGEAGVGEVGGGFPRGVVGAGDEDAPSGEDAAAVEPAAHGGGEGDAGEVVAVAGEGALLCAGGEHDLARAQAVEAREGG